MVYSRSWPSFLAEEYLSVPGLSIVSGPISSAGKSRFGIDIGIEFGPVEDADFVKVRGIGGNKKPSFSLNNSSNR